MQEASSVCARARKGEIAFFFVNDSSELVLRRAYSVHGLQCKSELAHSSMSVAPRIHPDEAVFPQFERADLFGEEVVKQALATVAALCKLWT